MQAEGCNLRVNSDSLGQDFFLKVSADENSIIQFKAKATLHGEVSAADGGAAAGCRVHASAEVPEPDLRAWYTGIRDKMFFSSIVDDSGHFQIAGLYPRIPFDVIVADGDADRSKAFLHPLTPRGKNIMTFEEGEIRQWALSLAEPIILSGRVKTETSGSPVADATIQRIEKDGHPIPYVLCRTDRDGAFELRLTSGEGRYTVHALPPCGREETVELYLRPGEVRDIQFQVLEAVVLPIRVLDQEGNPVRSVRSRIRKSNNEGPGGICGSPLLLDEDGRAVVAFHDEVDEFRVTVSHFHDGPSTSSQTYRGIPGTVYPEETLVLQVGCTLCGRVVNQNGEPLSNTGLRIRALYDDGLKEEFYVTTNRDGGFSKDGAIQASRLELQIFADEGWWVSDPLTGIPAGSIDLGTIALRKK
jgi:hypothetical protein